MKEIFKNVGLTLAIVLLLLLVMGGFYLFGPYAFFIVIITFMFGSIMVSDARQNKKKTEK